MAKEADLYNEFLAVATFLNRRLTITPVLYGSLGLTKATHVDFAPQDIDILVPLLFLEEKWDVLKAVMEELGYLLIDMDEHEFQKEDNKIGFSFIEDLKGFAGVDDQALTLVEEEGASYYRLSLADYIKVYQRSSQDGYRRTKNDQKDLEKLKILYQLPLE
ncbi:hypothetical protein QWY14_14700 [Planococcus sp. N028]|uniref:Phosphoribosylanthranilate isomerase n=1 Tax=Planococcus shixiaomingii TaxID=3058393 RepID=A0ABT8N593_9BACL|nr:hypothetical protein [Planococcus sp. N028]MDN7243051.1 hypothetical protein [Planococcus sp. N028]